jgi:hypothetical protein
MTGGLIQLVAYGIQDIFLTKDPQITFFKTIYRRHTNFSTEHIRQNFIHQPDFNKKVSCIISKNGDLLDNMTLVLRLPKIQAFTKNNETDNLTKIAWVKKIAYAIVDYIEIEIGGTLIDRHYGEWINIWNELTQKDERDRGLDILIGNIDTLTDFTTEKDEYTLYLPIKFWFSRSAGLALPIIALQYSQVQVNLQLNDLSHCLIINPSNYIEIINDLVGLKEGEYIEQNIDGQIATGIFNYYDVITKRLYYLKLSNTDFRSLDISKQNISTTNYNNLVYFYDNSKYLIYGKTSGNAVMPKYTTNINTPVIPKIYYKQLPNINISDGYLLVNYVYLDEDERIKFAESKHDYIIEQVQVFTERTLENATTNVNIDILYPCKFMTWIVQPFYYKNNYDYFNYTDSNIYVNNKPSGESLINQQTIILNSQERISLREYEYFNNIQPYQHFKNNPGVGINVYSFCLFPQMVFPTGSCNMSMIDNVNIQFILKNTISNNNPAKFRGYGLCYNILRIASGLGGLVFEN